MAKIDWSLKRVLVSCLMSVVLVGALVGNAYMVCNIGYPPPLQLIGGIIFKLSFIFAIPPGIVLLLLSYIGLEWPLRGRESFIESNPWLWVYCVVFYVVFIYLILTWLGRQKPKKETEQN
jgi:hypothetical protein